MKYRHVANQLTNRQGIENQENYLNKLLELEKNKQLDDLQQAQASNHKSKASMKDNYNCISGLNNLGNTCFFNAILQNLAQTPLLEDLLNENLKTHNLQLVVKHNDDFDSELTDFEEEAELAKASSIKISNNNNNTNQKNKNITISSIKLDDDSDSDDTKSDFNNNSDHKKPARQEAHRSIRLNELNLVLKEPPGSLTKTLFDVIKSMTSSSSTVNPNSLFSAVCKKVPSFKGFQQQDSHELLRNLLDAVKNEELRRRQAAILEIFRINKSSGVDELIKKKIKRYGRLCGYTLIDNLFGGHLLSSIVCEECKSCMQRVEPFLDLSLPIVDDSKSSNSINLEAVEDNISYKKGKNNRKQTNASLQLESLKKDLEDNNSDKKLSKHQTKKQKKISLKKTKKKGKRNQNNQSDEENEPEASKPQANKDDGSQKEEKNEANDSEEEIDKPDDDQENEKSNNTDKKEEQKADTIETEVEIEKNLIEPLKQIEIVDENKNEGANAVRPTEAVDQDSEQYDSDDSSLCVDFENKFKLEAMKSISTPNTDSSSSCASLESCLKKFTSIEVLSDKINCENCTRKLNSRFTDKDKKKSKNSVNLESKNTTKVYTKAIKQYLICELPCVLTIHLKRFQQYGFRLEKSNKHVNFPLVLDMTPYTSKMCTNLFEESVLYSLYGIVEHSGRLNSGHYTSYVKARSRNANPTQIYLSNQRLCHLKSVMKKLNPKSFDNLIASDRGNYTNQKEDSNTLGDDSNGSDNEKWYYISDSRVTEVSLAKVLKVQAYILFYERIK